MKISCGGCGGGMSRDYESHLLVGVALLQTAIFLGLASTSSLGLKLAGGGSCDKMGYWSVRAGVA